MRKKAFSIFGFASLAILCLSLTSCRGSASKYATYGAVKLLDAAEDAIEDAIDDYDSDNNNSNEGYNVSFRGKGSQADYGTDYRWYWDTDAKCPTRNDYFKVYKYNGLNIVNSDKCYNCGYTYGSHN